ncbi:MAG: methyl-accepting chemotaxis protein [Gammaproteobacteria bacterium]|nr:methyl-accepting chemotaxis protein [Gammaproteobacteria bacterium]
MLKVISLPALWLMGRLNFAFKFSVISALFIMPILVLGYGLWTQVQKQSSLIASEIEGLEAIKQVYVLIAKAEQFRDLSTLQRADQSAELQQQITAISNDVQQQLDDIKPTLHAFENASLDTRVQELETLWQTLQQGTAGAQGGVRTQFQYYDGFVIGCHQLLNDTATVSRLILDSELSTYLLINLVSNHLHHATINMGIGRAMGSYGLSQGYFSSELYDELDKVYAGLTHDAKAFEGVFKQLPPEHYDALQTDMMEVINGMLAYRDYLSAQTIEAMNLEVTRQSYFTTSSEYMERIHTLAETLINYTEVLLQNRADALRHDVWVFLICTLFLLLGIFYLIWGMYLSIIKTVRRFDLEARQATNGDLTVKMQKATRDELSLLSDGFNQMIQNIREVVVLVKGTSEDVVRLSDRLGETAEQSRHAIHSQQEETLQLTDEIKQIAGSTQHIAGQTESNTSLSVAINQRASEGVKKLDQALEAIEKLIGSIEQSSESILTLENVGHEIEEVLSSIQDIADQTNLLALNAAIEAARAGEEGRGFAVVAEEVRNLASKTVGSTQVISEKTSLFRSSIQNVVSQMAANSKMAQHTVSCANEASDSLQAIFKASEDINESSANIAHDAQQQNTLSTDANTHIGTIEVAVKDSIEVVNSMVAVTNEFNSLTQQLSMLVGRFKVEEGDELPNTTQQVAVNSDKTAATKADDDADIDLF